MIKRDDFVVHGIDAEATGRNVFAMLREDGLTVTDVSDLLGVSPQAIYGWNKGKLPSIDNLVILSGYLGCSLESMIVLYGDIEEA